MIIAAAIGFGIIMLFFPIFLVFGITKETTLILFYTPPLSAMIAFLLLRKKEVRKEDEFEHLYGKWVIVSLKNGRRYKGRLAKVHNGTFCLEYGTDLDDDSGVANHMFIDSREIHAIEIS